MNLLLLLLLLVVPTFPQEENNPIEIASEDQIIEESDAKMEIVALKTTKNLSDVSSDITIITQEDIKNSTATRTSEILRDYGIAAVDASASSQKGADVFIRGFNINYLLIIVDGQKVKDGTTVLANIPLTSIEKIEIVKRS